MLKTMNEPQNVQRVYTAEQIADWLLAYAEYKNKIITRKSLQKLLYFAQAHNLEKNGNILFSDEIEAWVHGPVVPQIWKNNIENSSDSKNYEVKLTNEVDFRTYDSISTQLLLNVWATYSHLPAQHLENKTHKELPWIWNWDKENNKGSVISTDLLRGYYLARGAKLSHG